MAAATSEASVKLAETLQTITQQYGLRISGDTIELVKHSAHDPDSVRSNLAAVERTANRVAGNNGSSISALLDQVAEAFTSLKEYNAHVTEELDHIGNQLTQQWLTARGTGLAR